MTIANLLSWHKNNFLKKKKRKKLQVWDNTVTFLYVLVQLVDKGVQLLPLLGRKLKCITGVNPLTQGAGIEQMKTEHQREQSEIHSEAGELMWRGGAEFLPGADALSVGSHQSEQRAETLRNEPLQYNHTFTAPWCHPLYSYS